MEITIPFFGTTQVYNDKTVTSLEDTFVVAFPVHVVLLQFTKQFRRLLMYYDKQLQGCLFYALELMKKMNMKKKRERPVKKQPCIVS